MPDPAKPTLQFAGLRLDLQRQQLWRGDAALPLRPKAWALLLYLVERPGQLVAADELIDALWPAGGVTAKALTNRMMELRRQLGDDQRAPHMIQTVYGRGYRFIADLDAPTEPAAGLPALRMPADAAHRPARLVGRTQELAALQTALRRAAQGQRQVVLVGGEPGLGKSALVDDFRATLATQPLRHGLGQCVEQGTEREPFGPVLLLLADLMARPGGAERLVPLLRQIAPSWLLQMPWLVGPDEIAHLQRMTLGAGPGRMLRELCMLLEQLSQDMPLVLVLEDLQWADESTVDLLAYIAQGRGPARLLVVATWRDHEARALGHAASSLGARLAGQSHVLQMQLGNLSPEEVQVAIARRFDSAALAHTLAPLVWRQSEGLPLFMAATMDHLVECGAVLHDAQGWQLDAGWAAEAAAGRALPGPVRQVIERRLALLSPEVRHILEAASVVGKQFSLQALSVATGKSALQLELVCDVLVQRQALLRPQPPVGWPDGSTGSSFSFVHDAYRQVLYGQLGVARRQQLHAQVAHRIEQAWGARVAEVAPQLASDYEIAGRPAHAARMLELTAGLAVQRLAYREALDAIEAGLAQVGLLRPAPARSAIEIRLRLAAGNLSLGVVGQRQGQSLALQAFQAAETLAHAAGAGREALRARLGMCLTQTLSGQTAAACLDGRVLVQMAAEHPDLLAVAHTYAGVADLSHGSLPTARQHFETALQHTPAPGVPLRTDAHTMARVHLGRTLVHLGLGDAGCALAGEAVANRRALGLSLDLVQTLFWSAECHRHAGRVQEAMAQYTEVLALADDLALPNFPGMARIGLLSLQPQGPSDLDEINMLAAQLQANGQHWFDALYALYRAEACAALGDVESAQGWVARGLAMPAGGALYMPALHALQSRLAGLRGRKAGGV